MSFSIKTMPEPALTRESISPVWAEVTLGEFVESFPLIVSLWTASEYERQWATAIEALVTQRVGRAMLVTDIQDAQDSDAISCFVLFREGSRVFVRQRFMRPAPRIDVRIPDAIEASIPLRIQAGDRERSEVSEWCVTVDDLGKFLESLRPAPSRHQSEGQ
jgi:hypothetical protein